MSNRSYKPYSVHSIIEDVAYFAHESNPEDRWVLTS